MCMCVYKCACVCVCVCIYIYTHFSEFFLLYGFPCDSAGKESACNAGDLSLIPGLGRSPGEGKGYPLQYSGLENSMDSIVHGVTKNRTQLSDFHLLYSLLQASLVAQMVPAIWGAGFDPWVWKIPWRKVCNPLQYSCLENPHGQRSQALAHKGHKE